MRTTVLNHFHTFHPEAQAAFDRLVQREREIRLEQARRSEVDEAPRQRMSVKPRDIDAELAQVREEMDEYREVIASGVVRIVVKGLSRGEYRRLLVQHPPREDDWLDQKVGYNGDTFGDALIQACIVKTLAHELNGGGPVPNEWDTWADEMTEGQWEEVFTTCLKLTTDPGPSLPR